MATLTLTLNGGDIKKAVKSDTYITGQIDKSADSTKNAALAYNEAAGDDSYHEVKLYRTMKGAVAKFEANMVEYVDPGSGSAVSNTLTVNTSDDSFKITIPVGSRFYEAFANTLSALAQEYIINIMLYAWWQSIKPALAKDYYQFAQESLVMVTKTLSKTPPETSLTSYQDVKGEVIVPELPAFQLNDEDKEKTLVVGDTFSFGYTLGTRDTDDIVVYSGDNAVVTVEKDAETQAITLTAAGEGDARVMVTSEGCPQVGVTIHVTVDPEPTDEEHAEEQQQEGGE